MLQENVFIFQIMKVYLLLLCVLLAGTIVQSKKSNDQDAETKNSKTQKRFPALKKVIEALKSKKSEAKQLPNLGGQGGLLGGLQQKKSDPNMCKPECMNTIMNTTLRVAGNSGHIAGIKNLLPDCCKSKKNRNIDKIY